MTLSELDMINRICIKHDIDFHQVVAMIGVGAADLIECDERDNRDCSDLKGLCEDIKLILTNYMKGRGLLSE